MAPLLRALQALTLVLSLFGCATTSAQPALVGDAQLAARVKTAIINDPVVGTRAIEVRVSRGVARLSGRLPTQAEINRVIEITRGVAGVTNVQADLQIGAEPPAGDDTPRPPAAEARETDSVPGLLAVGVAAVWSNPASVSLGPRLSLGPLFKLGSGAGLGPAIGFDWFQADLESPSRFVEARLRVKPVMGGMAYTWRGERVSLSPSIVAGYAFNSVSVTGTGTVTTAVPVKVDNGFVWRIGTSAWFDVSRRVALNLSAGRIMTRLHVTVLEDGGLARLDESGNTTILRAGLAYRIF